MTIIENNRIKHWPLKKWFILHFQETDPPRNMSKFTTEGWVLIMVGVFLLVCLIVGTIHTLYSFKPNAEAIMSEQAVMQSELDIMKSQQIKISEAVETWSGVEK